MVVDNFNGFSDGLYRPFCSRVARMIYVFDLDETVLDSTHRQIKTDDKKSFLAHWRKHNTAKNILRDKPLPLLRFMRMLIHKGNSVWILTAREMGLADLRLLENHGIRANVILSRKAGDDRADDVFKVARIRPLLNLPNVRNQEIIFFDDKARNREALASIPDCKITGFDPATFNGNQQPRFSPFDLA